MKSIPSLVASSTVGVAATGLVFGRPQLSTPARPTSNKRKAAEYDVEHRVLSSSRSLPTTSSTVTTPIRGEAFNSSPFSNSTTGEPRLPSNGNTPNENQTGRTIHKSSAPRRAEVVSPPDNGAEGCKDSLSSRGSWYKRLSIIQASQQGSPRSSIGPDSPSLTFSHGSAAPILQTQGSPVPLPPNKLVKRTTSGTLPNGDTPIRRGSRTQVPTLRRPATSHQRSVTLQQQFRLQGTEPTKVSPQHHSSPAEEPERVIIGSFPSPNGRTSWRLYFESRSTKLTKERPSAKSSDGSADAFYSFSRRIILPESSVPPTLLKATMITEYDAKKVPNWMESFPSKEMETDIVVTSAGREYLPITHEAGEESHKRPRRSLSMHFSSPTRWISRSSSLRASKRGGNGRNTGKRFASAPVASMQGRATISTHDTYSITREDIIDPAIYQSRSPESDEDHGSQNPFAAPDVQSRARNSSSPLPPLSRLSSFNLDLTRMGLSSSSSSAPQRTPTSPISPANATSPSLMTANERSHVKSSPKVVIHQIVTGSDRASTLVGSDTENRGFASGEEDEMDFQSDTAFDSYRTGTTGSIRARNPPLEMMFDDSPPSKGYKAKAAIARDIANNAAFRDTNDKIVEEDEGMVTPIKYRRGSDNDRFNTPTGHSIEGPSDDVIRSSLPSFYLATNEFTRLSLEDEEEDEDWTKEDDSATISNPLSPPSSSVNSRRVSSAIRTALADVTKSSASPGNTGPVDDRPRSLFDWSEPFTVEKADAMGNSPRPKTAHGKQVMDGRGGRTVGRRGPSALHIRSQSVPVVPDGAGHRVHTKLAPKFGTWGLGGKGVNEDWDNDFEFDGMDVDETENGDESMSGSAMLVPPAIQASQANVVGHVGQIREVCLLVEDLKRLRGLARERGILDGSSAGLWREAEGIIALAIPDEDDETMSPPQSPSSATFDDEDVSDRYHDGGVDIEELSGINSTKEAIDGHDRAPRFMRDGPNSRRKSVFSPGDDIFGVGGAAASQELGEERIQSTKISRQSGSKGSTDIARSVMEHIHQHRASSDPLPSEAAEPSSKMPFDTTSLRDLVHRANALSRILAELIRKADGSTQSPHRSPQGDRESSPAFTRVFTDPLASPPKRLPRSQSNNSILSGSMDASPSRPLGKRMHMMTVV